MKPCKTEHYFSSRHKTQTRLISSYLICVTTIQRADQKL